MAVMMLKEQGALDYDDPVVRFLPELSRFGDALTIRHLLTHTGGLPDYYDVMVDLTGVERPVTRHALDVYKTWGEPLFAPGERYAYSNPGYELLALVVGRASGQPRSARLPLAARRPAGLARPRPGTRGITSARRQGAEAPGNAPDGGPGRVAR